MFDVAARDMQIAIDQAMANLRNNAAQYESLLLLLRNDRKANTETRLRLIECVAEFAVAHHPGRFADGRLENPAWQLGTELSNCNQSDRSDGPSWAPSSLRNARRRVLHVTSSLPAVGGHVRTINNWIRLDHDSQHNLIVTNIENRRNYNIPYWIQEAVRQSRGQIIVFPHSAPIVKQASWLKHAASQLADVIVLHHDGWDVAPIAAFAGGDCPPVARLNHADHEFWLGCTVADLIINQRGVGQRLSESRRPGQRNTTLVIPLREETDLVPREDARRNLGIPSGQTVLLSVGRSVKYIRSSTRNFFRTAGKILSRNDNCHLYVVGPLERDLQDSIATEKHARIHLVGEIEDPSMYRAAADIYLESFPWGSATALLEAALAGIPVVPAYSPLSETLVASSDALEGVVNGARSEDEYVEQVNELIRDAEARVYTGALCRRNVSDHHVGDNWLARLEETYSKLSESHHCPRPIAALAPVYDEGDLGLGLIQATPAPAKTDGWRHAGGIEAQLLLQAAHALRNSADYISSLRLLLECCPLSRRRSSAAIAKLLAHRAIHSFGRSL